MKWFTQGIRMGTGKRLAFILPALHPLLFGAYGDSE